VQAALRLARAATGRNVVIKFEGHYHGWFDNVLVSNQATPDNAGPASRPNRNPGSAGQDPTAWGNIEVLGWNDPEAVRTSLAQGDVAAVIMEPMMCNAGGILPVDGYLAGVRDACTRSGTVLIFDEVVTGFRVSPGGAQRIFGVTPDLATFGKCIANGFPLAAVAGRGDLMDQFVSGGVVHGGTYNAHPISMAAALATLRTLQDGRLIDTIAPLGRRLMDGIASRLREAGIPAVVSGLPQIFHVGFGLTAPPRDYRDLMPTDRVRYIRFCGEMLKRRVRALERGAWFMSAAHDEAIVDETLAVVSEAAREL
jgi:glutamate-1-semialdehyde 2,1-aminomutase